MELAVPELLFGDEAAGSIDGHGAVLDFPGGLAALFIGPLVKVGAIEEDDSIGGWWAWVDDGRLGGEGYCCEGEGGDEAEEQAG